MVLNPTIVRQHNSTTLMELRVKRHPMAPPAVPPPSNPRLLARIIETMNFHELTSSPENDRYRKVIYDEQHPMVDGPVAAVRTDLGLPADAAQEIKRRAHALGADLVGITAVMHEHVYDDRRVPLPHAIVVGMAMDHPATVSAPAPGAGIEITRVYMQLGWVVVRLAAQIRELGYDAIAHHPRGDRLCDSELLFIPHAIAAGFGQLGRHGTMLTPRFGPRVRLGIVSTALPLAHDRPIDPGFDWFCQRCDRCVRSCPGDAISRQKVEDRGALRWIVNHDACLPWFVKYDGCGLCISECVLNLPTVDQTERMSARIGAARDRWAQRRGPEGSRRPAAPPQEAYSVPRA